MWKRPTDSISFITVLVKDVKTAQLTASLIKFLVKDVKTAQLIIASFIKLISVAFIHAFTAKTWLGIIYILLIICNKADTLVSIHAIISIYLILLIICNKADTLVSIHAIISTWDSSSINRLPTEDGIMGNRHQTNKVPHWATFVVYDANRWFDCQFIFEWWQCRLQTRRNYGNVFMVQIRSKRKNGGNEHIWHNGRFKSMSSTMLCCRVYKRECWKNVVENSVFRWSKCGRIVGRWREWWVDVCQLFHSLHRRLITAIGH